MEFCFLSIDFYELQQSAVFQRSIDNPIPEQFSSPCNISTSQGHVSKALKHTCAYASRSFRFQRARLSFHPPTPSGLLLLAGKSVVEFTLEIAAILLHCQNFEEERKFLAEALDEEREVAGGNRKRRERSACTIDWSWRILPHIVLSTLHFHGKVVHRRPPRPPLFARQSFAALLRSIDRSI